ncbi:MAG TPA: winged helix-turn-helix domain-containing protein [Kaistiaceae bacterium]|nr:winged helix-turn-helix domain-containing protein [Kaistiaceae bacterium]
MKEGPNIAYVAMLIGDPARANMLTALMAGKALTASELASEAGVTLQTASSHLAKLMSGGLLTLRKQGRHKYFALASDEVAKVLEGLMGLAAGSGHLRTRTGPRDAALRKARVCYDHLAGEAGTRLYRHLVDAGLLRHDDGALQLTGPGRDFVGRFGVDLDSLERGRAVLCRECLDWSERTSHLAGSLGRALLARMEDLGWARRDPASRAILFSARGEREFDRLLAGE